MGHGSSTRIMPLTLILVILVASILQLGASSSVDVYTVDEPYIVRPFYGLPEAKKPGDEMDILVKTSQPLEVLGVEITGLNASYTLEVLEVGGLEEFQPEANLSYTVQRIKVRIPGDVQDGLYNLIVRYNGGEVVMPRSLVIGDGPRGHIRVFHITDQHLGAVNKGIPNTYKDTRYIALINTLYKTMGVDIVVVTGDQADIGGDIASHKAYFSHMNQLLIPTLIVPGNHDWAQVSTLKSFLEYLYGKYQNSLRYWSFVYGDFLIIGIDTRGIGYPEDFQLDFLNETLHKYSDKTAIVIFHHPIFNTAGFYSGGAEENRRNLYYSWRELGFEQAKRFFQIMEENKNLLAIFSGHVHRDADAVWTRGDGSKVYFITTTTANHGYPEGYYWGAKIADVYTNGTVKVVIPSGRPYFFKSGSINTERFMVIEHVDPEKKAVTWSIDTVGFNELDTSSIYLVFYMNKSEPASAYKLYGDTNRVKNIEYYDTGLYHLFIAEVDATGIGSITLASYNDTEPPTVDLVSFSPKRPKEGKLLTLTLRAGDQGWGVSNVTVYIEKPDGTVEEVKALITNTPGMYMVVYNLSQPGHYKIIAEAYDFNGNKAQGNPLELDVKPRKTTTTTTTTEETTTTQETQTTTTSIQQTTTTQEEATEITETRETTTTTEATSATTTTTTITSPTTSKPPATTASPKPVTPQQEGPPIWAIGTIIAVTVIVIAYIIMARRS